MTPRPGTRCEPGRGLARPRSGHAVVWAESPLQLLSAVEGHGAGLFGRRTVIHPRSGSVGLSSTLSSLMSQVPDGVSFTPGAARIPSPRTPGMDRWVIGDAFSGTAQRQLMLHPPAGEVVVLDDGLATRSLLASLASERPVPLVRPRVVPTTARRTLGLATWFTLRRLMRAGRLVVFTALPVADDVRRRFADLGGHLESHRFEWLDTQPVPETVYEPTVLVGSAMPADGLIDEAPYVDWVHSMTDDGPVAYFPHRREEPETLARIAAHPMIRMKEHTVPVEMRLRSLAPGQRVHCLPSTVLASLGLILAPSGVRIFGHAVPDQWWTTSTPDRVRHHLSSALDTVGG
ncbi:hypothetical protein [Arthrobacter castelli]|uniref:hypothetical protein n=1 Tax=Arthrobacter castelli TaxID=271431 RepID=UPI0006870535|nr:hypothetical protein [Arthrobacter castelli]